MTISLPLSAGTPVAPKAKRHPLPSLLLGLCEGIARLAAHARLSRLSDRNLRDIGLTRGDVDGLRGPGSSRDAVTRLAIRAGQRAGNW